MAERPTLPPVPSSRWSRALVDVLLPRHTAHLTLRLLTLDDAPAMAVYRSQPEVVRYLGIAPGDAAQIRTWLADTLARHRADCEQPYLPLAVLDRRTGALIGDLSLRLGPAGAHPVHGNAWRHSDASIGYVIDPRFQGRGLAREAVGELVRIALNEIRVRKLTAKIFAAHAASIAVARATGFTYEYTMRSCWQDAEGNWLDDEAWSIIRNDVPPDPASGDADPRRTS